MESANKLFILKFNVMKLFFAIDLIETFIIFAMRLVIGVDTFLAHNISNPIEHLLVASFDLGESFFDDHISFAAVDDNRFFVVDVVGDGLNRF